MLNVNYPCYILFFSQLYVCNKYLAILAYVLKLVSNFTNIIMTVVSYYRSSVISKCFAWHVQRRQKSFRGHVLQYFRELEYLIQFYILRNSQIRLGNNLYPPGTSCNLRSNRKNDTRIEPDQGRLKRSKRTHNGCFKTRKQLGCSSMCRAALEIRATVNRGWLGSLKRAFL